MAKFKPKVFTAYWYHHLIVRFDWLVIIGIALVLFIPEYNYVIKPGLEIGKTSGTLDLGSYQKALEEEKVYLKNLKALKVETDKIDQMDLEKLDYVVASGSNLSDVLNQVYLLTSQNSLNIQSFSINLDKGVTTINLGLAGGNYEIFKRFLESVENNIQIMDITDLSLSEDQTSFSVTIKTYYQE